MNSLRLLLPLVLLSACSSLMKESEPRQLTLAELAPVAVLPQKQEALPQVSLDELGDIYREVLQENVAPDTRLLVLHRLADIEMLDSEAQLAASDTSAQYFQQTIAAYEELLRENPDYPLNDRVLYQLSKAYDLNGQSEKSLAVLDRLAIEHPQSAHMLEARFRRAESHFANAGYAAAEAAYTKVIGYGENTPYYTRALYMQGWSRFKQDHYQSSIASFTGTLDQLVPTDNQLESLPRGEREIALDTLRVLAVVFSYLEGTQTIASAYEQLGVRPYQHMLYEALGQLYLGQERYRDSASVYITYVERFPNSKVAHLFQVRVIESYVAGGFPELIISAKRDYVAAFGVSGDYWLYSETSAQAQMRDKLRRFIDELATYYHALAQAKGKGRGDKTQVATYYATAGDYYQLFLDSFPDDQRVPDMGFLLAESRFEAGNYPAAISSYEWVAYSFAGYSRAPDAGYAAILAYQRLASASTDTPQADLRRARVDSELRFASAFAQDSRAPTVLSHAAGELLQLQEYQAAIIAASTLTRWQPRPAPDIVLPAWLAIGHSHFELGQYASAEQAYQNALGLMERADPRRDQTLERVAASIYRQAEESVALGDDLEAARQFDRVSVVAPASMVRINAQFDAANAYMRAGQLERANQVLINFRQRYPGHELTASVGATLVANYEQLGQWHDAAVELDAMYAAGPENELKRQALYMAAQYYDRVGERARAIDRYRSYAHDWPSPFAEQMEAMNRLAELYQLAGEAKKRQFWLEKIVAVHERAGAGQTDRSRYLAARSSSVLADGLYRAFQSIELSYPIKKSLGSKKRMMELALGAYTRTNEYGIEQFSTLSTYRMGQVYRQLSADLINSQRPAGLDALALEQYELLLEEQAFPFEEKAIAIHESNARRAWNDIYDEWVMASFDALAELMPARYRKIEAVALAPDAGPEAVAGVSYPRKIDTYNSQAIALRQDGQFEAAEQSYLEALAVWEPHASTHRNIGILYDLYRGEQNKALMHFHRYLALIGNDDRTVAGWIADLERRQVLLVQGDM